MTDAPERIWAEAWWGERKHHRHHDAGDTDCEFTETEYILFDVHKALLAAERRKALEEGYKAGFMASGQGWNGEYPMQDKGADPEADDYWMDCRDEAIRALMEKEQGE